MTYNTRTNSIEQYQNASSMAQYAASYQARYYTSSAPSYQQEQLARQVVVRYTPDYQLSGFWKESGSRVEFVPYGSAQGQRLLAAFELLGSPLPVRRGASRR